MLNLPLKYIHSTKVLLTTGLLLVTASLVLLWRHHSHTPVNFVVGDAGDYYAYLTSIFIHHNLQHQTGDAWYLLKTGTGTINVHNVGESLLLLPFFAIGYVLALVFGSELNGISTPFQVTIALAGIFYLLLGLHFLIRLLNELGHSFKASLLTIGLLVFGTNLFNYTVFEPAMSHVYSFSLISIFLYYTYQLVNQLTPANVYKTMLLLGLILLTRPNNLFIIAAPLLWFNSKTQIIVVVKNIIRLRHFYIALSMAVGIVLLQNLIWYYQSGQFFHHTYKADGFYWTQPQILKLLFGFDNGFFIYTPICLVFLTGLIFLYRSNRFAFWAALLFFAILIYFFAAYWAYTYFDGLGIRVLVDYYAVLAVIGAKLSEYVLQSRTHTFMFTPLLSFLVLLNLIYCYQNNRAIILRAGMTFEQWRYTFLKVGKSYQGCLGGANDLEPYAKIRPTAFASVSDTLKTPFNYEGKEFGLQLKMDSLGVSSNRLHIKLELDREEQTINSSNEAFVCLQFERQNELGKAYLYYPVKLNDVPSTKKKDKKKHLMYAINVGGQFKPTDRLSVYIWNKAKQAFRISKFNYKLYNYNYSIN